MGIKNGGKRRKNVLIDSSSTIILFKSCLLEKIVYYYNVILTESVFAELTENVRAGSNEVKLYRNRGLIAVRPGISGSNAASAEYELPEQLGTGERDTILLFLQGCSDFIILDDGKGAHYCKEKNIPYINALIVPRIFSIAGIISGDEYESLTMSIVQHGRYSEKIKEYARNCSPEKLMGFM